MGVEDWFVATKAVVIGILCCVLAGCASVSPPAGPPPKAPSETSSTSDESSHPNTATPIEHVVVIFQENVSFDHYFATYPIAENNEGETPFVAAEGTPSVNGLDESLRAPNNPNKVQPFRLSPKQAATCSQRHAYAPQQKAFNGGAMDRFVQEVGRGGGSCGNYGRGPGLVMGYFDGNTVTGYWNYAQHFAMSDSFFNSTFGPSTPGAVNLISGQTAGFSSKSHDVTSRGVLIDDPGPAYDKCSYGTPAKAKATNRNVGNLLNDADVTWGWFQGGFGNCSAKHSTNARKNITDYIAHHNPFAYYKSTSNPKHSKPASVAEIGNDGKANHSYDLSYFWKAVDNGTQPAVSFLKAPAYQDGHAGYSTPLYEQQFVVSTINRLQQSPDWATTAVIITYDDSDGWYDHVQGPDNGTNHKDRAGFGPRLPFILVSPWAKTNYVDHTVTDQSSVLRFIEDNWGLGRIGDGSLDATAGSIDGMFDFEAPPSTEPLWLDPKTGAVLSSAP
jgi:phospholipase C